MSIAALPNTLFRTFIGTALLSPGLASAAILVTNAGYLETFDTSPPANQWATEPDLPQFDSPTDSGTQKTITFESGADVDAAVTGSGSGSPALPSSINNGLATVGGNSGAAKGEVATHFNDGSGSGLQMRPSGNYGSILMATLQNDSGAPISAMNVGYDFTLNKTSTDPNDIERIAGWRAYYSTAGDGSDWTHISAFDGGSGVKLANLEFLNGWDDGESLFILWVDDNAPGIPTPGAQLPHSNEDWNILDNFQISGVQNTAAVPEPSGTLLAAFAGMLSLLRRRRSSPL